MSSLATDLTVYTYFKFSSMDVARFTSEWSVVDGRSFDGGWSDDVSLVEGAGVGDVGPELFRASVAGARIGRSVRTARTQRAQRLLQRRGRRTRINHPLCDIGDISALINEITRPSSKPCIATSEAL